MSRPFRLLFQGVFAFALACGAAGAGCASMGEGSAYGGGCVGLQCPNSDAGMGDGSVYDSLPPDVNADADSGPPTNALCGTGCNLDDPLACATAGTGATPPDGAAPTSDAAAGDATPSADATPAAEAGTDAGSGPGVDAGAAPDAAGDAAGDAAPDAGPPPHPQQYGCYLTRQGGKPEALCEVAGSGTDSDPCVDSSDCAPGYGCVLQGTAGTCRHFCCEGDSACETSDGGTGGTFCAVRPLKSGASNGSTPQMAPVCVPADGCDLSQPYPCTASDPANCTCPDANTACMVVGDGLTSCITPQGTGTAGDPCPCAWGNVCSQATGKCLKICSLTASDSGCGSGKCQASKQMPDYFGVCVPSSASDGGL